MFRSLRTGEVIDERWLRFFFPTFWHYDILRGLDYLRNGGIKPDRRVREAMEVVIHRRHQNGRWPLNLLHRERIPLEMEPLSEAQAAGTRCAPSASCVGTATQGDWFWLDQVAPYPLNWPTFRTSRGPNSGEDKICLK